MLKQGPQQLGYSLSMSKLVPSVVVDKNGKTTTVHKKPDAASNSAKVFGIFPANTGEPSRSKMLEKIMLEAQTLSSYDASMYKKIFKAIRAEYLPSVLEILKHDDASLDDIGAFDNHHGASTNTSLYNEWVGEYTSRYWEMKSWSSGHTNGIGPETIAKLIAEKLHSRSKGMDEETSEAVMRLTCAVVGTGLSGGIVLRTTSYGLSMFSQAPFIQEFAERYPEPEAIEKACALIGSGKLNRLGDLNDVFGGDVPASIAEGIL